MTASTPTRLFAVRPYPKLVWHYCVGSSHWSLCGQWVSTRSSVTRTVSNIPADERACKKCVRKFEGASA
jgi:hypothetical protein